MADKKVPLSIVINTVDKATAKIQAINKRLDVLTAPIKNLNKATKDLRDNIGTIVNASGLPKVVAGFRGVGGAVQDLLGKVFLIGGAVGGATLALKALVDDFDDMGDKAERVGTSVDFLAQLRYAAERSGAEVATLDSGLGTLSTGMGQLRAGTGRMLAFLNKVSPALVRQLKGTKSNEEAFLLLADATAKLTDPAKRAALAQKTLGDA